MCGWRTNPPAIVSSYFVSLRLLVSKVLFCSMSVLFIVLTSIFFSLIVSFKIFDVLLSFNDLVYSVGLVAFH